MRPLCGLVALLCVAPLGGARVRFCCKTELGANALGDPACGRQDLVFVGQRFGPRPWSPAQVAELAVSAGTNVLFLVPLRLLAARGRVADACSCAGLVVASTAYHWCDVRGTTLLGMTGGNWHRLDNIFAFVSFAALVPLLMGDAGAPGGPTRDEVDFVRWATLFVGLFFQELNPWNVACTVAPIFGAYAYGAWWLARRAPPGHGGRFRTRTFASAAAANAVALCFFALGLDEKRDVFRAWHGLWHLANAAAAALFLVALDPLPARPAPRGRRKVEP